MLIKVYGGSRLHEADNLCDTCRHSTIVRGRTLEEEIVLCRAMMMQTVRITFKVTSCSDYEDSRQPAYCELVEKAWILTPGTRRRPAGFVRAADLRPEELYRGGEPRP